MFDAAAALSTSRAEALVSPEAEQAMVGSGGDRWHDDEEKGHEEYGEKSPRFPPGGFRRLSTPRSHQLSPMSRSGAFSGGQSGFMGSPPPNPTSAEWNSLLPWLMPWEKRGVRPSRRRKSVKRSRRTRKIVAVGISVFALFYLLGNGLIFSSFLSVFSPRQKDGGNSSHVTVSFSGPAPPILVKQIKAGKDTSSPKFLYDRLLALAAHALAENHGKPGPPELWKEPLDAAASWKPCASKQCSEIYERSNGYIIVTANGGISQQRVAICNAVAVTRLLNATLVIPRFQYNSVWRDESQFSDIYQEDHFISYLKADLQIVKELPFELQSLDLEAIGSLVTDAEVMKEAKPSFFVKKILPILFRNKVVHFVGFGNRLAYDPIPFELQGLRCKCNFHALRFINKIQETGALLVQRMRKNKSHSGPLEDNLIGQFAANSNGISDQSKASKYLAVHLRFEIDMVAYSLCYFGGGEEEEEELETYRSVHFPALTQLKKATQMPYAATLRAEGQCPLSPEEAVLMLAALGFKRKTPIYIAGSHIYGGKLRMAAMRSLYPNILTKEKLLLPAEIEPFLNYSSQLAALDFIACAAADVFAMTDSGSQLSALVSGFRMYFGGGRHPTIQPNKRRLASIFSKNSTIEWRIFEQRVRKGVRQNKRVIERPIARSIYRHPRCLQCMCKTD